MAAAAPTGESPARATGDEPRSLLAHGAAALAISALGLAIAGSVAITTNAQPTVNPPAATARTTTAPRTSVQLPGTPQSTQVELATASGPLTAFGKRDETSTSIVPASGTALSEAVVNERAAQRAEDLSKSSEEVSRAVLTQSSSRRGNDLADAEKATNAQASELARENLRKAIAARVAAEAASKQNEAAANGTTADPGVSVDTSSIPGGTGSSSPVPGAVIGARFGQYGLWARYHTGLDFRASYGTPIRAVTTGVVLYAGNSGDWAGNHVAIAHAGGYTSMSCHMSSIAVHAGQTVQAGQIIGYVGQTGRAFGPHLHFEIYPPGVKYGDIYKAIDPVPWLARQGVQTH